jgi:hypothetical protein
MTWDIELTDKCRVWYEELSDIERARIIAVIDLLESYGPGLPFPYSSGVRNSRHHHMRELRVQQAGRPYRILYAFDPRRTAILLVGGDKTGNTRWYESYIPLADDLYDEHLSDLE